MLVHSQSYSILCHLTFFPYCSIGLFVRIHLDKDEKNFVTLTCAPPQKKNGSKEKCWKKSHILCAYERGHYNLHLALNNSSNDTQFHFYSLQFFRCFALLCFALVWLLAGDGDGGDSGDSHVTATVFIIFIVYFNPQCQMAYQTHCGATGERFLVLGWSFIICVCVCLHTWNNIWSAKK